MKQEEVYVAVDLEPEADEQMKSKAGFPAVAFLHPLNQSWWSRFAALLLRLRLAVLDYILPAEDDDGGSMKVRVVQDDGSSSVGFLELTT